MVYLDWVQTTIISVFTVLIAYILDYYLFDTHNITLQSMSSSKEPESDRSFPSDTPNRGQHLPAGSASPPKESQYGQTHPSDTQNRMETEPEKSCSSSKEVESDRNPPPNTSNRRQHLPAGNELPPKEPQYGQTHPSDTQNRMESEPEKSCSSSEELQYYRNFDEDSDRPCVQILESEGFHFNKQGKLVDVCNKPFEFNRYDDAKDNQERYETICTGVEWFVNDLLEERLIKTQIRGDGKGTFIFTSRDYQDKEHLLVLIHGSGAVRAGQWSRRLIINDKIDSGTQLPYIDRALELGWGVLVTNTNDYHPHGGSRSPTDHGLFVWKHFVKSTKNKKIAIVAHSAGGGVTTDILDKYPEDFKRRVFAIAFTDAFGRPPYMTEKYFKAVTTNWVTSKYPLGTPLSSRHDDMRRVSAGTLVHEETSHKAIEEVFTYIVDRFYDSKTPGDTVAIAEQQRYDEMNRERAREKNTEMDVTTEESGSACNDRPNAPSDIESGKPGAEEGGYSEDIRENHNNGRGGLAGGSDVGPEEPEPSARANSPETGVDIKVNPQEAAGATQMPGSDGGHADGVEAKRPCPEKHSLEPDNLNTRSAPREPLAGEEANLTDSQKPSKTSVRPQNKDERRDCEATRRGKTTGSQQKQSSSCKNASKTGSKDKKHVKEDRDKYAFRHQPQSQRKDKDSGGPVARSGKSKAKKNTNDANASRSSNGQRSF